jgi:hypothetical protein
MIAAKNLRNVFLILMITLGSSLYSCTTTRIVTKYDSDTFANNPLNQRTTWSFAWGLVQPKDIHPKCDSRFNHLDQVTVKNNLGFALISVLSLGIVMPQRIKWDCAPYSPPTEPLGHD